MAARKTLLRIFLVFFAILLLVAGGLIYVYINLNKLLTNALNEGFHSNIISDVYELKFENLDVNIITGSVKVFDVKMFPRKDSATVYPYINSTFRMGAQRMILKNVDLVKLLRYNKLDLKKIELVEPGIEFEIADEVPVFFPYKPSTTAATPKNTKKSIDSYFLEEFRMVDAYFHVVNTAKVREFDIRGINISLKEILINRLEGKDVITYQHFDFSIGELTGRLSKNLRYVHFKDFNVSIDSLYLEESPDTIIYRFADMTTGINNLDIQTADSISHVTMESFNVSYKKNSIELKNLTIKPNISDAAMQKRFKYRKEHFDVRMGTLKINGINFDSLMYAKKLFIDEIAIDDVDAVIFKDLRKDFPPNHRPKYLGQQIQAITMPVVIGRIKATDVNLVNHEVKPDGTLGKANINRTTLLVKNFTSLPDKDALTILADAYIENAAKAHLQIDFSYSKPQFRIEGSVEPFDLTKLNALTNSYAPARIKNGIVDGITFSGMVYEKRSTGKMKLLYHDLVVDFELEDKAKWKSTVLGLAANTYLNASNPAKNLPVREVTFVVERDMRKGYLSMLVKSLLDGVKETFIMSKENKKAYKKVKKEAKAKKKEQKE